MKNELTDGRNYAWAKYVATQNLHTQISDLTHLVATKSKAQWTPQTLFLEKSYIKSGKVSTKSLETITEQGFIH